MAGSQLVVQAIRDLLRERGMTYRTLAQRLGVSEPTVKRDLGRGDFSLSRLDRICEVLDVTMADLMRGEPARGEPITRLSDAQEQALLDDPKLLLVTYLVVNDWDFDEIVTTYAIDQNELVSLLLRLDGLRIVDYRPPQRVRKLTARNFAWRKDGPVQTFFVRSIVPEFFADPGEQVGDAFHFAAGLLSEASRQHLAAAIRQIAREFDELSRRDSRLPLRSRDGCSAVLALRRWEYSGFSRLRRDG